MVHFAYRSCSHVISSQMQNEVPFMKENRLLFTNALIVLPTETIKGSLAVEDGKITGIFESGTELPGFTEVDVHGKALMPGAIDTHVHMWDPSPLNYREDWACGSQCAASGGITTIIDMPLSVPPMVDKEGFQLKLDVAQKESCVDFAFWGGLTPNCVQNMEELNRLGCVAYKGFMSFANPDYPQVTDGYLVQGMRKAATFNGLIGVHVHLTDWRKRFDWDPPFCLFGRSWRRSVFLQPSFSQPKASGCSLHSGRRNRLRHTEHVAQAESYRQDHSQRRCFSPQNVPG